MGIDCHLRICSSGAGPRQTLDPTEHASAILTDHARSPDKDRRQCLAGLRQSELGFCYVCLPLASRDDCQQFAKQHDLYVSAPCVSYIEGY